MPPPAEPAASVDPAEACRRARARRRLPIGLLVAGVVFAALGSQGLRSSAPGTVLVGFIAIGTGASLAVAAALVGRDATRRLFAVFGCWPIVLILPLRHLGLDRSVESLATGLIGGLALAWLAAWFVDVEWVALVNAAFRRRAAP